MTATSSFPQTIALDGLWAFAYTPTWRPGRRPVPAVRGPFLVRMPVPGYWDDHLAGLKAASFWPRARFNPTRPIRVPMGDDPPDAALPSLLGVGWYRRTFEAPPAEAQAALTLHVGGVVFEAWVWVNGRFAHYHLGHSVPFEVTLDDYVKPGAANTLLIAVANTRTDRRGCSVRGYAGSSGGIYRSVHVRVTGRRRIGSVYLCPSPDLRAIEWRVALTGRASAAATCLTYLLRDPVGGHPCPPSGMEPPRPRGVRLESGRFTQVFGAARGRAASSQQRGDGTLVLQGTLEIRNGETRWRTTARGMKPWSDVAPRLYEAEVCLQAGGRTLDRVTQPFGLRRLTRRGMGLRLNGAPTYLRGICEHAYFPLTCTPPTDVTTWRERIGILKNLGFNWLRFHTWVPPEEYLTAADELGMLIQVEPPHGFATPEWTDILRHARRHPSVVLYCCGNEEVLDEEKIRQLRMLARVCRREAPDALFNPQEALGGVEYNLERSPGRGFTIRSYPHNPRRLEALKRFSDVFGNYAWGWNSYRSAAGRWRVIDRRLKSYARPCLTHELGIHGCYLDLDLEHRYVGTRIGPGLYAAVRRGLRVAGLLDRVPLYYRRSCAWMRLLRKHAFETARLCRRLAGFDFLSAYDHHWHRTGYPCGLMNEFLELKPDESRADVLRYNGANVLLIDHDIPRAYTAGDRFVAEVHVSAFGPRPLTAARLAWRLADEDDVPLAAGAWTPPPIRPGDVRTLGAIRCVLPAVSRGRHVRLQVRLTGREYEIDNVWSFWIFPPPDRECAAWVTADDETRERLGAAWRFASPETVAPARVVSRLTADAILGMSRRGERVLLLGHEPFAGLPLSFQISVTGRVHGNLATILHEHPVTRAFPHEGYCDWQFQALMEGGHALVFDRSRRSAARDSPALPFQPILEVVSSFKRIIKQAALCEWTVGAGRLMVCGLNVAAREPAARYWTERLLRYITGARLAPAPSVSPRVLTRLLTAPAGASADAVSTDQAHDPRMARKRRRAGRAGRK